MTFSLFDYRRPWAYKNKSEPANHTVYLLFRATTHLLGSSLQSANTKHLPLV